jgi:hypothetical protein
MERIVIRIGMLLVIPTSYLAGATTEKVVFQG